MSSLLVIVTSLAALAGATSPASDTSAASDPHGAPADEGSPITIDRGEGFEPIEIPRGEQLEFEVVIDTLLGDLDVGTVTLSSGTVPYNPGLPLATDAKPEDKSPPPEAKPPAPDAKPPAPGAKPPAPEAKPSPKDARRHVGTIQSVARGSYLGYTLHHELDVRHLPQPWPSAIYRDRQSGSENRQRELKFGVLDGKPTSIYRSDGHCKGCSNPEHFVESAWIWGKPHHCEKCKRAEHRNWEATVTREIPAGTVDLLSAVYLARAFVRDGGPSVTFPVIDKKKLWQLTVTRGGTKVIEVPAGKFRCALVQLQTAVPPGEPPDKDGFAGLFGIRGTIKIWMEASTGVPVMITGELPVPVIKTLDLYVKLASSRGTVPGFLPVK